VFTGGADDGVDGTVVLAPGDIVFPFKSYVREPVSLTIEQGRIVDIAGGLDADLLREYMASFDDDKAYGISHIGWGMLETAKWGVLAYDDRGMGMHGRSFYGNVLFSTGPNGELGGPNDTLCHVDAPMRNCSLYLDERPIVIDGDIVVDELAADSRHKVDAR
jgi:2,5-dihydroxypyridine 5,6-dioxygenase